MRKLQPGLHAEIVHASIAIMNLRAFTCVCVHLRLGAFVSTVRDRPRARTCMRSRAHAYICARCERHLKSIK